MPRRVPSPPSPLLLPAPVDTAKRRGCVVVGERAWGGGEIEGNRVAGGRCGGVGVVNLAMGRLHLLLLEEDGDVYSCKHCMAHIALGMDIFSKYFQCRHGKAYLFTKVVNVSVGQEEERQMTTGMHTVADIFCVGCGSILGWKYEAAHVKSQKYKEGMFILERFKVLGPDGTNYCESDDTQDDEGDAGDATDSLNLP